MILVSPPYVGSFRVQEHDFGELVTLDRISIDGGIMPDGSLSIYLYGKETASDGWTPIGVYTFLEGIGIQEMPVNYQNAVRFVKYGLTGTEGVQFVAPTSDPTPGLFSVTLFVPEPSRWLLLAAGLGCLMALCRVRGRR